MTVSERLAVLDRQLHTFTKLAAAVPDPEVKAALLRDAEAVQAILASGRLSTARDYPTRPRRSSRR